MHNQASEPFCTSLSNPETWHTVLAYGLCPMMSNGIQVLKSFKYHFWCLKPGHSPTPKV